MIIIGPQSHHRPIKGLEHFRVLNGNNTVYITLVHYRYIYIENVTTVQLRFLINTINIQ
jgi:hypothetical protein